MSPLSALFYRRVMFSATCFAFAAPWVAFGVTAYMWYQPTKVLWEAFSSQSSKAKQQNSFGEVIVIGQSEADNVECDVINVQLRIPKNSTGGTLTFKRHEEPARMSAWDSISMALAQVPTLFSSWFGSWGPSDSSSSSPNPPQKGSTSSNLNVHAGRDRATSVSSLSTSTSISPSALLSPIPEAEDLDIASLNSMITANSLRRRQRLRGFDHATQSQDHLSASDDDGLSVFSDTISSVSSITPSVSGANTPQGPPSPTMTDNTLVGSIDSPLYTANPWKDASYSEAMKSPSTESMWTPTTSNLSLASAQTSAHNSNINTRSFSAVSQVPPFDLTLQVSLPPDSNAST
ncbi:hypothetical protein ABKN59_009191 [Abortiporus biennis]